MPVAAPVASGIGLGLGALGLLQQQDQARKANNMANAGLSLQQQEAARQAAIFDTLMNQYKQNNADGVYNPDTKINLFRTALDRNQNIVSGNLAGNAAILGYRPGDTTPLDAMGTQANQYKLQEAEGEQNIRDLAHQRQMNDLLAINGGSSSLTPGLNAGTQDYEMGMQRMASQNPAGILGSLAPMFMRYGQPSNNGFNNYGFSSVATGSPLFNASQNALGGGYSPSQFQNFNGASFLGA